MTNTSHCAGGLMELCSKKGCCTVFITGIVILALLIVAVLILISIICGLVYKVKRQRSALREAGVGVEGKKPRGIIENPVYNDLPMNDTNNQDPCYHELQAARTTVSYDTVSSQPPTQTNYDDVVLSNYQLLGEDQYMKNKPQKAIMSSHQTPNYDDVILSNYDVVASDESPKTQAKGKKGYGKAPAPPPPSGTDTASEVTTTTVTGEKTQPNYDHLIHHHQQPLRSTSVTTAPPENYSRLDPQNHSSSLGKLEEIAQPQNGTSASSRAVRKSVDLKQLLENDSTEVFYCNTTSASPQPQGHKGQLKMPEEDDFYINVKH